MSDGPRITAEFVEEQILAEQLLYPAGTAMTICVITLRNGYVVTGTSTPVSPENYDKEMGDKISRDKAVAEIWPLQGFLLKELIYQERLL